MSRTAASVLTLIKAKHDTDLIASIIAGIDEKINDDQWCINNIMGREDEGLYFRFTNPELIGDYSLSILEKQDIVNHFENVGWKCDVKNFSKDGTSFGYEITLSLPPSDESLI